MSVRFGSKQCAGRFAQGAIDAERFAIGKRTKGERTSCVRSNERQVFGGEHKGRLGTLARGEVGERRLRKELRDGRMKLALGTTHGQRHERLGPILKELLVGREEQVVLRHRAEGDAISTEPFAHRPPKIAELPAKSPSGIMFTSRAHRLRS